jgi:hypothetical protein
MFFKGKALFKLILHIFVKGFQVNQNQLYILNLKIKAIEYCENLYNSLLNSIIENIRVTINFSNRFQLKVMLYIIKKFLDKKER